MCCLSRRLSPLPPAPVPSRGEAVWMTDGDNIPRWLTERGRRHGRMWVREFLNVGTPVPSGSGGPAPWAVPAHPGLGVWHPPSSCPGGPGHPLLGLALICYQFCCLVSEGQRFPAWEAHTASGKRLFVHRVGMADRTCCFRPYLFLNQRGGSKMKQSPIGEARQPRWGALPPQGTAQEP